MFRVGDYVNIKDDGSNRITREILRLHYPPAPYKVSCVRENYLEFEGAERDWVGSGWSKHRFELVVKEYDPQQEPDDEDDV